MKYYTIKEISNIIGVSKTTIQKTIKENQIEYDYINKNKQCYSISKTISIIKSIRPNFNVSELEEQIEISQTETENSQTKTENQTKNFQKLTENSQTETEISQTKTENSQSEREIEALNRLIDIINKQLDEKDKQLAIKDKQIEDLSNRLAEALELTKGQQYIAVADKAQGMITSNIVSDNDNQTNKGFWNKLFRK